MSSRERYRQFCEATPDLPVFAQPWYLDAAPGGQYWDAVVVEEGGRPVAALPYCLKRRWGFRYATLPLFVKYLGPLLAPGHRELAEQHRLLGLLIEGLPRLDGFETHFQPDMTNWLPFYWRDFRQTTYYTYRIDLTQPHWAEGINRNLRRNLRKAEEQLHLRHDLPLAELHRLIGLSFARQGRPLPYAWPDLERHHQALADRGARQLFFAEDEQGRIHSAACLIWDGRAAYYHLSGDDPALRDSGAGIWLAKQAIEYARQVLGLPVFDFEGSMIPAIEAIRRQFGAQQTSYFRVWKAQSKVFGWVKGW